MPEFAYDPKRDASATIRGFYYQFIICVDLWLKLAPNESLALEQGEDIDRIASGANDNPALLRELIQVKDLSSNITIRASGAKGALANFHGHLTANPDANIAFVFLTSAAAGCERPQICSLGPSMILLWNQVAEWPEDSPNEQVFLRSFRSFISDAPCPTDFDAGQWAAFVKFTQTAKRDELRRFVTRFHWAVDQGDWTLRKARTAQTLISKGHAKAGPEADSLLNFLIATLFDMICSGRANALTVAELTTAVTRHSSGTETDSRFQVVLQQLQSLEQSIGQLTNQVEQLGQEQILLARKFNTHLLSETGGHNDPQFATSSLNLEPLLPSIYAHRPDTVKRFADKLQTAGAILLWGAAAQGKTVLALLVAESMKLVPLWIGASQVPTGFTQQHLLKQLERHSGHVFSGESTWLADACRIVAFKGLTVLDNIPAVAYDHPYLNLLVKTVGHIKRFGGKVICLAHNEPVGQESELWAATGVPAFSVPTFNENDVKELATVMGAPSAFSQSSICQLITALTRGHPVLVRALLDFVQGRNWGTTKADVQAILAGGYKHDVLRTAVKRLVGTVNDASTRGLLYRLEEFGSAITPAIATKIARVDPEIDRMGERFSVLDGAWLRRLEGSKYEVTPLISGIGREELASGELKGVHSIAADEILGRQAISHNEAALALSHLGLAERFDRLVRLFIQAFQSALQFALNNKRSMKEGAGVLLAIWADSPLPNRIASHYRMYMRAWQIAVRAHVGLPTDYLAQDFLTLLRSSGRLEPATTLMAGLLFTQAYAREQFNQAHSVALEVSNIWTETIDKADRNAGEVYQNVRVWISTILSLGVRTVEQLDNYFSFLLKLTPDELNKVEKAASLYACYWMPLLFSTQSVPADQASAVSSQLVELHRKALKQGREILATALLARAYYLKIRAKESPDEVALAVAKDVKILGDRNTEVLWLQTSLADALFAQEDNARALPIYQDALARPGWIDTHDHVEAALYAAISADRLQQPSEALRLTKLAVEVIDAAQANSHLLPHDKAAALAELSVALVANGFLSDAVPRLEEAVDALHTDAKHLSREQKATLVTVRIIIGALAGSLVGAPGLQGVTPALSLAKHVHTGDLSHAYETRAGKFSASLFRECYAALALLAERQSDAETSQRIAQKAYRMARAERDRFREALAGMQISSSLLRQDNIEEVLDIGARASTWFIASRRLDLKPADRTVSDEEISAEMAKLDASGKLGLAEFALLTGVVPALCAVVQAFTTEGKPYREQLLRIASIRNAFPILKDQKSWQACLDMVVLAAQEGVAFADLTEGTQQDDRITDSTAAVVIATLLTLLDERIPMHQAFGAFCNLGSILQPIATFPLSIYERHFDELTVTYWKNRFANRRFQFRLPNLLQAGFTKALTLPAKERPKELLRTLRLGFKVVLPERMRKWFEDQPSATS